ncbi:MAG: alanine racemase [Nitrospirae bacterium]|nr:alanine racemase [Nitrospirota bacterium]
MGTIKAEISLSNLIHNLKLVRQSISPLCKILTVVKANAYGHGIIEVSKTFQDAGADMLGVAHVEEGIRLREAGIHKGILVLGGISEDYSAEIVKWRLTPVVYTNSLVNALSKAATEAGVVVPVHIKVDTGMRRIGVEPENTVEFAENILNQKGLHIEGIMTHFAEADLQNKEFVNEQLDVFLSVCNTLQTKGINIPLRHTANSAAVMTMKDSHLDMVRPGIMLYGYSPGNRLARDNENPPLLDELKPVMTLKTRIIHIKKVPKDTGISYGRTFVTKRETIVATILAGYADGFSRSLSNKGEVIVKGEKAPVIGRVCMDMTMIDVTDIQDVADGDEVIIIGGEGENRITADDIAMQQGTISYEVLCGVGERVERVYLR